MQAPQALVSKYISLGPRKLAKPFELREYEVGGKTGSPKKRNRGQHTCMVRLSSVSDCSHTRD
jgi:hypothetical protein